MGSSGRILARADPNGVRIEILPPISSPPLARRFYAAGSVIALGSILAVLRIAAEWRQVANGRDTVPLLLLAALTAAVVLGSPFALFGLAALLFAEETLEIGSAEIVREIAVFGRESRRPLPRAGGTAVRWTTWPVAPWWTWTFKRLALVSGRERMGVGATLGNSEKRELARLLEDVLD